MADNTEPVPKKPSPLEKSEPSAPKLESHQESPREVSSSPPREGAGAELQSFLPEKVGDQNEESATGAAGSATPAGPVTARFGTTNGPRVENLVKPKYPFRARRLHKEGRVLLRLRIDRSGAVRSGEVVESAGYGFDESALEAVRKSRFSPATRNGRPVECLALLPVQFVLEPYR